MTPKNEIENGIARLRAELVERAARCEQIGREAGETWAVGAGARALHRLATAIGRSSTVRYIGDCAADSLGLATRLYLDITGPTGEGFIDVDDVKAYWYGVLDGDADAIQDPERRWHSSQRRTRFGWPRSRNCPIPGRVETPG